MATWGVHIMRPIASGIHGLAGGAGNAICQTETLLDKPRAINQLSANDRVFISTNVSEKSMILVI